MLCLTKNLKNNDHERRGDRNGLRAALLPGLWQRRRRLGWIVRELSFRLVPINYRCACVCVSREILEAAPLPHNPLKVAGGIPRRRYRVPDNRRIWTSKKKIFWKFLSCFNGWRPGSDLGEQFLRVFFRRRRLVVVGLGLRQHAKHPYVDMHKNWEYPQNSIPSSLTQYPTDKSK